MAKLHPFANAYRCEKAAVEEVPLSVAHPTGLRFLAPCRCPAYMAVDTRVPVEGAPTLRRDIRIEGCQANLFPWMQGALIAQSNAASADAEKMSGLVTDLAAGIEREVARVGQELGALRQANASGLAMLAGAATIPGPVRGALDGPTPPLLAGEWEG